MNRFFLQPRRTPDAPPAEPSESRDAILWRTLLESSDDVILLLNADGQVLLANSTASLFFPEIASSPSSTLLSLTLSSEMEDIFREAVQEADGREDDLTLNLPTPRSLHVRVLPVTNGEFLVVLRDQTALRRLERIRRDFVANVSHELRTPLTSIKAMAETLMDGALQDESVAQRFLQTIIHESDRLVRLSSDLLDLSRVEARQLEKIPLDLGGLVAEVCARFTAHAQKADVSLTNAVQSPLVVSAASDEMAQVLVNLLDNAINYTPRGGSVTVSSEETEQTVTIRVTDTGIGILSHDIPRLFERFYRADKARSRSSGGTGLGLSIVKHIIESHDGTVGVTSEYNRGSTFEFTLPKVNSPVEKKPE